MAARPILYYALFSPPSRACLLTSKLINLNLELKPINFAAEEHKSDWYLKINPRNTVPVLVEQDTALCESHAILTYMISKYGQDHHEYLYPRDLLKRAVVDERLYYDNGILFQVLRNFVFKILYGGEICYDRQSLQLCHKAYAFLEMFLSRSTYVAGEHLSVADISINPTLITLHKLVELDEKRYPKVSAWMQRMSAELPAYEEVNEKGAQQLFNRFQEALEQNMTKSS